MPNRRMLSGTVAVLLRHSSFAWISAILLGGLSVIGCGHLRADEGGAPLPFDPARISRLSLDGLPRSLAAAAGGGIWLGYDLERARPFRAWRAKSDEDALSRSTFTAKPRGKLLFSGPVGDDAEGWRWRRDGRTVVPEVRYLGIRDVNGAFVLSWELRDGDTAALLHERIGATESAGARELRAEGLGTGEVLLPPADLVRHWKSPDLSEQELHGDEWHRFDWSE